MDTDFMIESLTLKVDERDDDAPPGSKQVTTFVSR